VRSRHFWSEVVAADPTTEAQQVAVFAKLVLQMCATAAAAADAGAVDTAHARQLFALAASCLKLSPANKPGSWQLEAA
jgi:hypothetical protein